MEQTDWRSLTTSEENMNSEFDEMFLGFSRFVSTW